MILTISSSFVNAYHVIPRESVKEDKYDPYIICEGQDQHTEKAFLERTQKTSTALISTSVPPHMVFRAIMLAAGALAPEATCDAPRILQTRTYGEQTINLWTRWKSTMQSIGDSEMV